MAEAVQVVKDIFMAIGVIYVMWLVVKAIFQPKEQPMNQASGMRNLGMIGGADVVGGSGANQARQRTLAERLESANGIIENQVRRVQNFVERVNGTPRPPEGVAQEAKIAVTMPLLSSVERAETLGKVLAELADGLERIG